MLWLWWTLVGGTHDCILSKKLCSLTRSSAFLGTYSSLVVPLLKKCDVLDCDGCPVWWSGLSKDQHKWAGHPAFAGRPHQARPGRACGRAFFPSPSHGKSCPRRVEDNAASRIFSFVGKYWKYSLFDLWSNWNGQRGIRIPYRRDCLMNLCILVDITLEVLKQIWLFKKKSRNSFWLPFQSQDGLHGREKQAGRSCFR